MPRNALSFAVLATLAPALSASAQLLITGDVGRQTVTYGSSYDKAYAGQKTDHPVAGLQVGFLVHGHSQRPYGANVLIAGDLQTGFSGDSNTQAIFSYGGVAQVNARYRMFSVGSGFDLHKYQFADGSSTLRRPEELLFGVPVIGKVSFGPAGHAFVQGGVVFYVGNSASTVDAIGNTYSTAQLSLSKSNSSRDLRLQGGYIFGHFGLRASYVNRDVYFQATSNPTYASFFDFHQNTVSGGIVLTAF